MSGVTFAQFLASSGLSTDDIQLRPLGAPEKASLSLPPAMGASDAAIIQYFDIEGRALPHYRARLLNGFDDGTGKYRQQAKSPNYLYFPRRFKQVREDHYRKCMEEGRRPYVLIAEGEKKAALAVKHGIPACALGGVYSWRNRNIEVEIDSNITTRNTGRSDNSKKVVIQLPKGNEEPEMPTRLALGLPELINTAISHDTHLVIVFDTDGFAVKDKVQHAAAELAYELVNRGVDADSVHQLILPAGDKSTSKVGLDDFVVKYGVDALHFNIKAMFQQRCSFPRLPYPKQYIMGRFGHGKSSAEELHDLSVVLDRELKLNGRVYETGLDAQYYFINKTNTLIKIDYPRAGNAGIGAYELAFGRYMYAEYGVSSNKLNVYPLLADRLVKGVEQASPNKISTSKIKSTYRGHQVAIQASDSLFIYINEDQVTVEPNGSREILFLSGLTEPIDVEKFNKHVITWQTAVREHKLKNIWHEVVKQTNIEGDEDKHLLSLLCHVNPYLRDFRGMQLPILLVTGEHGTGKTTILKLMQLASTGRVRLLPNPKDVSELRSLLVASGGLSIFDNIGHSDPRATQAIQNELCGLVTSDDPVIQERKFYKNAQIFEAPLLCSVSLTSINPPYKNADFISRSLSFGLRGMREIDDDWHTRQFEKYGGREGWLAYECVFLQTFFRMYNQHVMEIVSSEHPRPIQYRMREVQTCLEVTARVFGSDWEWIGAYLKDKVSSTTKETDQVLQAISIFCEGWRRARGDDEFSVKTILDVLEQVDENDEYSKNVILQSTITFGRYLSQRENMLQAMFGMVKVKKASPQQMYRLVDVKKD